MVWTHVRDALFSKEVKNAIFGKLKHDLSLLYPGQPEDIVAYSRCTLNRDVEGFTIRPHPDVESKIVTVTFYLPADESQTHLGTAFYEFGEGRRDLRVVKRFAFKPNSGYIFCVSPDSWHGREKLRGDDGARNTLAFTYYHHRSSADHDLEYTD